ncbi:MAG: translation initiation factor 2 [Pseudomonadota bacterium]
MRTIILISAALSIASCATVIRGTKETAKFQSTPSGATVTTESISADKLGPFSCTTPCELELKRKRDWQVVFEKDGYKPVEAVLEKKVTGGGVASGAGNVLAGGIIGIGVDAGTGANLDLRPNPMIAELALLDSQDNSLVLSDPDAGKYQDPEEEEDAPNDTASTED